MKKISNYHDDVPPNRAELRSEIDLNNSRPVWDFSCFNKRKCPHYNYVICKRKKADNTYVYLLKMKLGESRPLGNYKMRMGFIVYEDEVDFDNYKDYDKMSLESDEEYSSRLQRDGVQEAHQLPIMISWLQAYDTARKADVSSFTNPAPDGSISSLCVSINTNPISPQKDDLKICD